MEKENYIFTLFFYSKHIETQTKGFHIQKTGHSITYLNAMRVREIKTQMLSPNMLYYNISKKSNCSTYSLIDKGTISSLFPESTSFA